jgi:TonB family protein
VIRQHLNEVRFCYEQGLSGQPDLSGRVTVAFLISPSGAVQSASVPSSTLGAPTVDACIAKAVRRWTFPSPEDGGVVFVKYPFMLKPASGD